MERATVVIAKDQNYNGLINKSFDLLGGAKKFFADKKQVFIKPNWVSYKSHIMKTNPELIREIASMALENGAKNVVIGDNPTLGLSSKQLYQELQLGSVFKDIDVRFIELDREHLEKLECDPALGFKELPIPQSVLKSDCLINVPVVKTHGQAVVSLGIKNLIGLLPDSIRMRFHREELHTLAVTSLGVVNPQLTIIDGFVAGEGQGPAYCDPVDWGVMFMGTNTVSTDAVCSWCMGYEPVEIPMIRIACRRNLGRIDLDQIDLLGVPPNDVKRQFKRAVVNPVGRYPCTVILDGACEGCIAWIQVRMDGWEKENLWSRFDPQHMPVIVCGKKVDIEIVTILAKTHPIVAFGDCLPLEIKELPNTTFVKGCPPTINVQKCLDDFLKLYEC